uniref:EGF-like domain-containing protein n=2 Tax=Clytia hemisphaerica TaxID=252671 RepID=A0A7M5WMM5_9CNID
MNLNSLSLSTQFEDEYDGKKYSFDFNALKKVQRRERAKIFLFMLVIFVLASALVVMTILYRNKMDDNKDLSITLTATKVKLTAARNKTANIGEKCHSTGNITKCGKNAYCRKSNIGKYFCDCLTGYMSDGSADCQDVHFSIDFKEPTTNHLPELRRLHFLQSDALSICFWFKLNNASHSRWMSAFLYTSVEIEGDNDLSIWVTKDQAHVYLKSSGKRIAQTTFPENEWSHLCWIWENSGRWLTYVNGDLKKAGFEANDKFQSSFPDSLGNLVLGQDKDEDTINQDAQMLHGSISQFMIYNSMLTRDDVVAVYQNRAPIDNIVVGWWQFKNITNSPTNEIAEGPFPKEILDREVV